MAIDIQRVPWRRGDTPQWDGVGWHQAAKPTSNQFWVFNGTTGLWAARALVDADLPSHGDAEHDNRTRNIPGLEGGNFVVAAGAQTYAARGANVRYAAWDLSDAVSEALTTGTFQVPRDWASGAITFFLHWTNLGAGSGNVVWRIVVKEIADAADINATASETSTDNTIAAPAQDILKISQHTVSYTPSAAAVHVRINVARIGGDAADSLTNDVGLLKLQATYTAGS